MNPMTKQAVWVPALIILLAIVSVLLALPSLRRHKVEMETSI